MKKHWLLAVAIISLLAIVGLAGCSPGETGGAGITELNLTSQQEGIWVSGLGKVTVVPDIANLRLGIEAGGTSVAVARDQAAQAMDAVMAALIAHGVAENDIQTQYFTIRRMTKWDREKEQEVVTGYRVINTVTAKIRDLDEIGVIVDAVAEAGGDLTRIDGIDFSVDDPSAYYDQARQEAMAEARDKAEQLAALAGVTLGKPTYLSEGIQYPPISRRVAGIELEEAMVSAAETPISPGELEISLSVQVVYAIK